MHKNYKKKKKKKKTIGKTKVIKLTKNTCQISVRHPVYIILCVVGNNY